MIVTRNRKRIESEIKLIVEDIFDSNEDIYYGYHFVSAVDRKHIVYVCRNGHERGNIPPSRIRGLHQCGACVVKKLHYPEEVKRRVTYAVWVNSPKFLGKLTLHRICRS